MAEIARPLDTPAAMRCSGDRQQSPHRPLLEKFVCTMVIIVVRRLDCLGWVDFLGICDRRHPGGGLGFDGKALPEAVFGSVVGLIALFSSYDHVNLPQQWGVWLIALSLPLVFADAQLAARSRQRDADRAAVDEVGRRPK
jgi:hypothetical protein